MCQLEIMELPSLILGEMDYVVRMVFRYQFIIADLNLMGGGVSGPQMFQVKIGIRHMVKANQATMHLKFMEPVQPVLLPFGKRFPPILVNYIIYPSMQNIVVRIQCKMVKAPMPSLSSGAADGGDNTS